MSQPIKTRDIQFQVAEGNHRPRLGESAQSKWRGRDNSNAIGEQQWGVPLGRVITASILLSWVACISISADLVTHLHLG